MRHTLALAAALVLLTACQSDNGARITSSAPAATGARSEPVFYNGKTYQMSFNSTKGSGLYDMTVAGMGPGQKKDAVAVATSSLGYFACPDGQRGQLASEPSYVGSTWRMQARCG
jgi:hypothetical protein